MRILFWGLSIISIIGVWYSSDIHIYFTSKFAIYKIQNFAIIQVILAVAAGIFATKASDSSRELKKLLKVSDIQELLTKADTAAEKSKKESQRLKNIVKLVGYEVEQQFSREMLINHRKQLSYHWDQILKLESIFEQEETIEEIDPKVKKLIRNYIIRTQYLEFMGKGFLRGIPFFGRFLDYFLGPLWNDYYLKNLPKFNKMVKKQ